MILYVKNSEEDKKDGMLHYLTIEKMFIKRAIYIGFGVIYKLTKL